MRRNLFSPPGEFLLIPILFLPYLGRGSVPFFPCNGPFFLFPMSPCGGIGASWGGGSGFFPSPAVPSSKGRPLGRSKKFLFFPGPFEIGMTLPPRGTQAPSLSGLCLFPVFSGPGYFSCIHCFFVTVKRMYIFFFLSQDLMGRCVFLF